MKNTLVTSLILGTFAFPLISVAQVSDSATTAQVEELKSTLIALLTQMIADLQAQIAVLIAQQNQTETTVAEVSTKVEEVVKNTAPAVGSAEPPVQAPPTYQASVSLGNTVTDICYTRDGNNIRFSDDTWSYVNITSDNTTPIGARVVFDVNVTDGLDSSLSLTSKWGNVDRGRVFNSNGVVASVRLGSSTTGAVAENVTVWKHPKETTHVSFHLPSGWRESAEEINSTYQVTVRSIEASGLAVAGLPLTLPTVRVSKCN